MKYSIIIGCVLIAVIVSVLVSVQPQGMLLSGALGGLWTLLILTLYEKKSLT